MWHINVPIDKYYYIIQLISLNSIVFSTFLVSTVCEWSASLIDTITIVCTPGLIVALSESLFSCSQRKPRFGYPWVVGCGFRTSLMQISGSQGSMLLAPVHWCDWSTPVSSMDYLFECHCSPQPLMEASDSITISVLGGIISHPLYCSPILPPTRLGS